MGNFSKYFYKATSHCMCNDLLHGQSKNCFDSTMWNFTKIITGCCKYVLPIAITPALLKIRNLNLNVCKQSAKIFFEYSFASWVMGGCTLSFMCLFYQLFGTFYYFTLVALPAFCSSSICAIFLSNQLVSMFGHGLFCVMLEVFIRNGASSLFRALKESKIKRTLTFMIVNVLLMNLLKTSKSRSFWFLHPIRKSTNNIENGNDNNEMIKLKELKRCSHLNDDSCDTFIFQEIGKYIKLGLSIEIVKAILGNIKNIRNNPLKLYKYINRSCSLPAFLVSYSGIYRIFCCIFNRNDYWYINDSLAAFLCGIAYFLYPNPGLLCHAIALTVKLIWSNYVLNVSPIQSKSKTTNNWQQFYKYHKLINLLKQIPIARIFYPIAFGYLLHIRVFYPWLAPAVLQKLMNLTTGGKDAQLLTNFYPILFGGENSPETTLYLFNLNK